LDFAQAEKMVTILGDEVFALPANERRAVAIEAVGEFKKFPQSLERVVPPTHKRP